MITKCQFCNSKVDRVKTNIATCFVCKKAKAKERYSRKNILMKQNVKSDSQLKKLLWKVFSEYIKLRDNHKCFTCGRICEGQGCHAGHFVPKSVGGLILYFDEENVHCQCYNCNINLGGNQYEYAKRLGFRLANKLVNSKGKIVKDFPFLEKIDFYKKKINTLKSQYLLN